LIPILDRVNDMVTGCLGKGINEDPVCFGLRLVARHIEPVDGWGVAQVPFSRNVAFVLQKGVNT
jgi:hypothetical protein